MIETANKSLLSFQGIAESIALTMKDASTRYLLPDIAESQTVSILLAGCRDFVEGSVDYQVLYELLVSLDVFPGKDLQNLEVTLCGPELTSRGPFFHPSGRVKVFRASGRLQRQFPASTTNSSLPEVPVGHFSSTVDKVNGSQYVSFNTWNGAPAVASAAALYDVYSCVFIRNPGFSISATSLQDRSPQKEGIISMLEQWAPGINLLMDTGVLVLVAEYPAGSDDEGVGPFSSSPLSRTPDRYGQLPPLSPAAQLSKSASEKQAPSVIFSLVVGTSRSEKLLSTSKLAANALPKIPTQPSAEYHLDVHFHAKVVIPASPFPFRRQKWSTPFPSMCPDLAAAPHSDVYAPLPHLAHSPVGRRVADAGIKGKSPGSPSGEVSVSAAFPDGYYMAFQGRRDPQVTQQILFFTHMAALNAPLSNTCLLIARELGAGILHLPLHLPPEELELEAHRRDMSINPLKKQLLEKEKQDLMKLADALAAGTAAPVAKSPVLQFTRR